MQITTPTCAQILQCKTLWAVAFGDSQTEIDRFFDHIYPTCTPFVLTVGDRVAAMAYALPLPLCSGGTERPAAYLYAVATDPAYRGQGLCRALFARMEQTLLAQGVDCLLLSPATEGLAEMYRKFGFSGSFAENSAEPLSTLPTGSRPCTPAEYAVLREHYLQHIPHLRYSSALLDYADAACYTLPDGCAALRRQEDGFTALEWLQAGKAPLCTGGRMTRWLRAPAADVYAPFDFA